MSTEEDIARAAGGEKFVEELRAEHARTGSHASSMTLRDHFAGLAMQALTGLRDMPVDNPHRDAIADRAYLLADAMLERRRL